jgi:hypothetical protein
MVHKVVATVKETDVWKQIEALHAASLRDSDGSEFFQSPLFDHP